METLKTKQNKAFEALKKDHSYKNAMQSPRILKVVVSSGVGSFKDKNKMKVVEDRLAKITGQKASPRAAKVAIANFKSRQGDIVGYQVTLRGTRMYDFLERLVHIALPRTKDFRGVSPTSADEMGNYTLGIKEHSVFPETADEELKDVFGLAITVVTTAKSKAEVVDFLTHMGFPFKK
ncbi:MAG: 50S ribosomal protein L5 [Parcubacteria group bacterium]